MKRNMCKLSNSERIIISIMIIIANLLIRYSMGEKTENIEIIISISTAIILVLLNLPIINEFLDSSLVNDKIQPMQKHSFAIMTFFSVIYVIINAAFLYGALGLETVPQFITKISYALNHHPDLIPILILAFVYGLMGGLSIKYLEIFLRYKYLLYSSKSNTKFGLLFLIYIFFSFLFYFIVGTLFSSVFDLGEIKTINHIVIFFLLATIYVSGQFFEPLIERIFEKHSNKSKPKNIIFQVLNPTDGKPIELSKDIIVTLESDNGPIKLMISKSE
ncbi:hypothetical protein [Abiotrophia defectiva]|uniref:hypothetical protein n=1 Tax=Abiotrophia defectiva TaxID=46125 RepID=UPI0030CE81C5